MKVVWSFFSCQCIFMNKTQEVPLAGELFTG